MIQNEEIPIGFTMELAQHADILEQFSKLSEQEMDSVIEGSRHIESHAQMRDYVTDLFR